MRETGISRFGSRARLAVLVVLLLAAVTATGCGVGPEVGGEGTTIASGPGDPLDEEYAVWSALIQTIYIDARGPYRYSATSPALIVIEDATPGIVPTESSQAEFARTDWPELGNEIWTEIWTDFEGKNQTAFMLERRFTLSVEYVFISERERDSIFSTAGEWTAFYDKYPDSQGVLTLWRVGFNGARDTAVVYAHNQSGGLMGEGSVFLLEKTAGGWTVRGKSVIAIS